MCMVWPKPTQKPYPPIHVGGGFPHAVKRAIRYGDGWIPIGGRDGDLVEMANQARAMVADAGRDAEAFEVSIYSASPKVDDLKNYADGGINRAVFALPPAPRDEIMPILDKLAAAKDAVT